MRNMSFALTTEQVRTRTKTVTRRTAWKNLKPGTLLQPVVKSQGLKKGETVEKIGGPIRVVNVSRIPLYAIYKPDCIAEGFPELTAAEFIAFFCAHNKTLPADIVTRIEFEYL